jgi:hypothetical protein
MKSLVVFLYTLMRDELVPGTVAEILTNQVEVCKGKDPIYTNKHLEAYAREVAERLLND